jgi:hypothetical protein
MCVKSYSIRTDRVELPGKGDWGFLWVSKTTEKWPRHCDTEYATHAKLAVACNVMRP